MGGSQYTAFRIPRPTQIAFDGLYRHLIDTNSLVKQNNLTEQVVLFDK